MLVWTHRRIAAEPQAAWDLLCDLDRWPDWGPSVRGATLDPPGAFVAGATGRVATALGPSLPFRLDRVDEPADGSHGFGGDGRVWAWSVLGVGATAHSVRADDDGCVVGFGAPLLVAPYLAVCAVALRRIEDLLTR